MEGPVVWRFLGPDPLQEEIEQALSSLQQGRPPAQIETSRVDFKEEPERRDSRGRILSSPREDDRVAQYLAREMACMANSPGGGSIILGVADDGTLIGTETDPEWLRHRIWELTERKLTISALTAELSGNRLLVFSTHEAIEPIRYKGRIRWRVDDHCVEIDPTTWHNRRMHSWGFDWSAQLSGHLLADASPIAIEIARRYLRDHGHRNGTDLSAATDEDLLRRVGLVDHRDRLTNAGTLLFVTTPDIGIDYLRRQVPGGDSTNRVRGTGPLLAQIYEVEQAGKDANRISHVRLGFVHRPVRSIPSRAVREAIVNGVVHRDWSSPQPTTVEHIGDVMTITSPGGFVGGVTSHNIITHPASPRYRSLAEAVATLGLAEREGIGVDRMISDMLAIGRPAPDFQELPGPYVRVSLFGGDPDRRMIGFLDAVEPEASGGDVDLLLILEQSITRGWVDARSIAPVLQRSETEAGGSLQRVAESTIHAHPIIVPVHGVPLNHPPAYRLSNSSKEDLAHRLGPVRTAEGREALIMDWARARGRVSSTEVADLTGLTVPYSGTLLSDLAGSGRLVGSRPNRMGRGFHYLPVDSGTDHRR